MYNFKITIHLIKPVPNPHPAEAEWFPLLASVYGNKTSSFDGYVSGVEYLEKSLIVYCYLVEDNENMDKLAPFKQRYSDWNGYQKICIMDALKLHMRILGYNASIIEIIAL